MHIPFFTILDQLGFVAVLILLILFILSIISWAVIISKSLYFVRLNKETIRYQNGLNNHNDFNENIRDFKNSPYLTIINKIKNLSAQGILKLNAVHISDVNSLNSNNTNHYSTDAIIDNIISSQMAYAEKHLVFLSTTVSVSPFLGLLGTVWGIMNAFISMGTKGSASIVNVGPGIAEALTTTIAGLAVAIPALIAYNYFIAKLRTLDRNLYSFIFEFIKINRNSHEIL